MLFSMLYKAFLTLSVEGNLENVPCSFRSSFYHWQPDNRNVLEQSWCFWRWCMRRRGSSLSPSRQMRSAEPRGRNKLPGEWCRAERLFESIYCFALSVSAKNACFLSTWRRDSDCSALFVLWFQVCICSNPSIKTQKTVILNLRATLRLL